MGSRSCAHCGRPGVRERFCSARCRKRGWRRERAELPADAYPDGWAQGSVPLGQITRGERRARIETLLADARETLPARPDRS